MVEIEFKPLQGGDSPKSKRKISKSQSLEEQLIQSLRSTGSELTPWKFEANMNNEDQHKVDEKNTVQRKQSVSSLVDELLCDIYSKIDARRKISFTTCDLSWQDSDCGKYSRLNQLRNNNPEQLALRLMSKGKGSR